MADWPGPEMKQYWMRSISPEACCQPPSPRTSAWCGPARGGKPAKVYKVDLEAIQERGDVTSNYQIFPGDRLIVGRNEVVKKTVEIDRLTAPIHTTVKSIHARSLHAPSIRAYRAGRDATSCSRSLSTSGSRSCREQVISSSTSRRCARPSPQDEADTAPQPAPQEVTPRFIPAAACPWSRVRTAGRAGPPGTPSTS